MSGTWNHLQIAGKRADVYEPPGPNRPRFGVLYLHGADEATLRDQPTFTRLFEALRLACVCPSGGQSWWSDRSCPSFDAITTAERYLLQSVLPFFRERWGFGPRFVGLLGLGMGGQGALRLAFKHPDLLPVVAAISPAIEYHELYGSGLPLDEAYDSKEQCRQDTVPMHVHPAHYPSHLFFCMDPEDTLWFRGSDRLHEKLAALGIPHETDFTTRASEINGNFFDRVGERAICFLVKGLEQESRRLL
jgi:pimeloyl-ACP methyl ester carboxylesterase